METGPIGAVPVRIVLMETVLIESMPTGIFSIEIASLPRSATSR